MQTAGTEVVGGGQAGLGVSYFLQQQGIKHIVFEQGRIGESWQSGRWDSFQLNTPNARSVLAGMSYEGTGPDGFWRTSDLVDYFQRYVNHFQLPVRRGLTVLSVERANDQDGFLIKTRGEDQAEETVTSRSVVVAAGIQRVPKYPVLRSKLPDDILQLHTSEYRNPQSL